MCMRWFLQTRKGVLSTKLTPVPQQNLPYEQCQRYCDTALKFHKTVIGNNSWKMMAHVFADFFHIEMLQAAIA